MSVLLLLEPPPILCGHRHRARAARMSFVIVQAYDCAMPDRRMGPMGIRAVPLHKKKRCTHPGGGRGYPIHSHQGAHMSARAYSAISSSSFS